MVAAPFLTTLLLALAITTISAKAVLERQSTKRLPLTKFWGSPSNSNVIERDLHRPSFLRRFAGNQNDSNGINSAVWFLLSCYIAPVGVGSPVSLCKWLQYFVADEEILTGSFFTDALMVDTGRWALAGDVGLLHAGLRWYFTARTLGLGLILLNTTWRQIQATQQAKT